MSTIIRSKHPSVLKVFTIIILALILNAAGGAAPAWPASRGPGPPADVAFGLSVNEQEGGGGLVSESIRILNGNQVEARKDLGFTSPHRRGLSFQAVYNSQSEIIGSLGFGWTHTYEVVLDLRFTLAGQRLIRIVDETGRAAYFKQREAGVFAGAFHERSYFTAEAGGFVWQRLDGIRYGFSASGNLAWIEDENHNRLVLGRDKQNRPASVTDTASGRKLTFHYTAQGRLGSIRGPQTEAVPSGTWITYAYDAHQNLITVSYADGSGFKYSYTDPADAHNLTGKQDRAGHLLNRWGYDAADRCVNSFSQEGTGVQIRYGRDNQVEVTDAYGVLRRYRLATIGDRRRVSAVEGPAGAPYSTSDAVQWRYDDQINLIEVKYAGGRIDRYEDHDNQGNPGTVRQAAGSPEERVFFYTYHPQLNVMLSRSEASVLGPGDKVTIWDYDGDNDATPNENPTPRLTRIIEQGFTRDTAGEVVSYEYVTIFTHNAKGRLLRIDGPLKGPVDITEYAYDESTGNLLTVTRPPVGTTYFNQYDNAGQLGRITDVNGQSDNYSYDGRGRITTVTHDGDGSLRRVSYNTAGLPDTVTDEDGIAYHFEYDAASGRLSRILDPEGNYTAYTYDAQGNRIEMGKYDAAGRRNDRNRWDFQHPGMPGKLWKEIKTNDTYSSYDYDHAGNLAAVIDFNGQTTSYRYDKLNRLIVVIQPEKTVTAYAYDRHGHLQSVTDAKGNQTTFEYDDMGRLTSRTSPDTGATASVYDAAGNLIRQNDANGVTARYTHDSIYRLTGVTFPDSSQDIRYSYDQGPNAMGRLTGITDPAGEMAFEYDGRGRLTAKTSMANGLNFTVTQTYSPGGRLQQMTYPSGRQVDYPRNRMGKIDGVSTAYNGDTVSLLQHIVYRPFGGPTRLERESGQTTTIQSSECDCVEVLNPGSRMERFMRYDGNGNLTTVRAPHTPRYNRTFAYDPLNRLEKAIDAAGRIGYTYDQVGNRQSRSVNRRTETYRYVPETNRLAEITGATTVAWDYDANGNTTQIGDRNLVYNLNNRLVKVEENGQVLGEYVYNGLGQRVSKQVDDRTTFFHYDFNGKLIAESRADGTITAEYLYLNKTPLAEVDVTDQALYHYSSDRLGTPRMVTDARGVVAWEARYKPFGDAQVHPQSKVENNFRFAGQYYDKETGLHYNYYRYYDPQTGRYLTPDPIGLLGGINLYAYVHNNPINLTDPFGLLVLVGQHAGFVNADWNPLNHAAIVLRPDNPADFANHPLFQHSNGTEATLGGQAFGPGGGLFGRLESQPNYPGDHPDGLKDLTVVEAPQGMTDTEFINALVGASQAYNNDALYDPFPDPWGVTYNSNSYVSGVIIAAGGVPPELPGKQPGYGQPLPIDFPPTTTGDAPYDPDWLPTDEPVNGSESNPGTPVPEPGQSEGQGSAGTSPPEFGQSEGQGSAGTPVAGYKPPPMHSAQGQSPPTGYSIRGSAPPPFQPPPPMKRSPQMRRPPKLHRLPW